MLIFDLFFVMREVVFDTETTGLNKKRDNGAICLGHRVIEIGFVESIDKRTTGRKIHACLNPGCPVDSKAADVHGVTDSFVACMPTFREVAKEFIDFIDGAVSVAHNAPFDVAFVDQEFRLLDGSLQPIGKTFRVLDALSVARDLFPGHKNTLDALASSLHVGKRGVHHGALVDAEILAHVCIALSNSTS